MNVLFKKTTDTVPYSKGIAFDAQDNLLKEGDLNSYFSELRGVKDFIQRADALNGSWCTCQVAQKEGKTTALYMGVDHRSTHPLFYRLEGESVLISDNGFDLLKEGEERFEIEEEPLLFFSQWGFTPEEHTLHPSIKRIPSGCVLYVEEGYDATIIPYAQTPKIKEEIAGLSFEEAKKGFEEHLEKAFDRMKRVIGVAPVVLPLSGGRDSRLIAIALKERNISPAITMTYGRTAKTSEVKKAAEIARRLGLEHRFVCTIPSGYTRKGYTQDEEVLRFFRHLSGLSSCYFFAEYNPSREVSQWFNGEQPYVLPGHNGDTLCGLKIHQRWVEGEQYDDFNAYLLTFYEGGNRVLSQQEVGKMVEVHKNILAHYPKELSIRQKLECFRTLELSSKYLINSSRAWSYHGSNVWMPFLDRELIDFAASLHPDFRVGKRIYESLSDDYFRRYRISFPDDGSEYALSRSPRFRFKQLLRSFILYQLSKRKRYFSRHDDLGFRFLMGGALQQEVKKNIPWHPTTINGLSFAWWLYKLQQGAIPKT
ncbi:asparagine synthase-related protein [Porphyromonas circumdentaria]|uniref:asparagine synthase-related protein n=1 Tax=Porphyromonas circumdentaria TaxID=29524 RepID=UPI0026DB1A35|nr:asparagine synthase C-terminal domain-containing protein [Porphyromonas circumdentaria]MDO4722849.1 asparagine synthase C-terminal domain-containing protein [Porphyromonas circumdentaria]